MAFLSLLSSRFFCTWISARNRGKTAVASSTSCVLWNACAAPNNGQTQHAIACALTTPCMCHRPISAAGVNNQPVFCKIITAGRRVRVDDDQSQRQLHCTAPQWPAAAIVALRGCTVWEAKPVEEPAAAPAAKLQDRLAGHHVQAAQCANALSDDLAANGPPMLAAASVRQHVRARQFVRVCAVCVRASRGDDAALCA